MLKYIIILCGLTMGISFIDQSGTPLSEYAGEADWGIKFL
jgi:hypothetical protein